MSRLLTLSRKATLMDRPSPKTCLARQMLLYRREGLIHRRNAQCVSHIDSPCSSGPSLRSISPHIQGIAACSFQSVTGQWRRQGDRHRASAESCFRGFETAGRCTQYSWWPIVGPSSAGCSTATPGGSAKAIDQSGPPLAAIFYRRADSFGPHFDRCR
jgi:hypothetical protein